MKKIDKVHKRKSSRLHNLDQPEPHRHSVDQTSPGFEDPEVEDFR